jgi:hypothetical protein
MPYGLLAAAFLAVRVQGSRDGGRRAMRGRAPGGRPVALAGGRPFARIR